MTAIRIVVLCWILLPPGLASALDEVAQDTTLWRRMARQLDTIDRRTGVLQGGQEELLDVVPDLRVEVEGMKENMVTRDYLDARIKPLEDDVSELKTDVKELSRSGVIRISSLTVAVLSILGTLVIQHIWRFYLSRQGAS